jgi:hypothetical protein
MNHAKDKPLSGKGQYYFRGIFFSDFGALFSPEKGAPRFAGQPFCDQGFLFWGITGLGYNDAVAHIPAFILTTMTES